MSKQSQLFLQPVLTALRAAFIEAKVPTNYKLVAEPRRDDPTKFELYVVVGFYNPLFEEGEAGDEVLQKVSRQFKDYLGLGFTESIGTCASIGGSDIDYVRWQ